MLHGRAREAESVACPRHDAPTELFFSGGWRVVGHLARSVRADSTWNVLSRS